MKFTKDILRLDAEAEADRICRFIKEQTVQRYKRKGLVVGISGGLDSAVITALCVRTLGPDRVFGLLLPEKESSPASELYARELADKFGVKVKRVDLTGVITQLGAYKDKNDVIKGLCQDYDPDRDKTSMSLPADLLDHAGLSIFSLTVKKPDGSERRYRLSAENLQKIVAAQNLKQRSRMMQLYYHAEQLNYVVAGTTNRTEAEQGFFVKYGDGGVDIESIAHLYKTQVRQLGRHLGVTENILNRKPSPDTWTGEVSDEQFYFRMPFDVLDLLLYAWNQGVPRENVQEVLALTDEQVDRAFRDFESKKRATWHLLVMPPTLPAGT